MTQQIEVAPPNSLILVMDQSTNDVPESFNKELVTVSPSCVAIGTHSQIDGETLIQVVSTTSEVDSRLKHKRTSVIRTPKKIVSLCSVHYERYLSIEVATELTEVEVWANHETEPDRIAIVMRPAS